MSHMQGNIKCYDPGLTAGNNICEKQNYHSSSISVLWLCQTKQFLEIVMDNWLTDWLAS